LSVKSVFFVQYRQDVVPNFLTNGFKIKKFSVFHSFANA